MDKWMAADCIFSHSLSWTYIKGCGNWIVYGSVMRKELIFMRLRKKCTSASNAKWKEKSNISKEKHFKVWWFSIAARCCRKENDVPSQSKGGVLTDADGGRRVPGASDTGRISITNELVVGVAAVPDDPPAASRPDPPVFQPRRRTLKRCCVARQNIIHAIIILNDDITFPRNARSYSATPGNTSLSRLRNYYIREITSSLYAH